MKGSSRKTSNLHKVHPTNCERCGRQLPRRHYQALCATCIKAEVVSTVQFQNRLFQALVDAGAKEIA